MKIQRKIEKIMEEINKKPIFICSEQVIKSSGLRFVVPKCKYVRIEFDDWNRLQKAIQELQSENINRPNTK